MYKIKLAYFEFWLSYVQGRMAMMILFRYIFDWIKGEDIVMLVKARVERVTTKDP